MTVKLSRNIVSWNIVSGTLSPGTSSPETLSPGTLFPENFFLRDFPLQGTIFRREHLVVPTARLSRKNYPLSNKRNLILNQMKKKGGGYLLTPSVGILGELECTLCLSSSDIYCSNCFSNYTVALRVRCKKQKQKHVIKINWRDSCSMEKSVHNFCRNCYNVFLILQWKR